jgi:hypothetical protein
MREDDLEPEDHALVAKLRELPPEGVEPDWTELEAAIRAEVGDDAPRPWWRNWRWIVPAWALATTTAMALLVLRNDAPVEQPDVGPIAAATDAGVTPAPATVATSGAMWLDGEVLVLDEIPSTALDELDVEARAALDPDEDVTGGILPITDYGWIDTLDDDALERADDWLKRKKS